MHFKGLIHLYSNGGATTVVVAFVTGEKESIFLHTPEFIPPASDQLFVQPVDTGAFAFDLLKMFLHFLPPF